MSASAPERLGASGVEILESLGQHRLLSTAQVHDLHTPAASMRWTRHLLARLRRNGLAGSATRPGGLLCWYVTEDGADALEAVPSRAETRRPRVTPEAAAGPLQEHSLAVNEVGLAFVRAARRREDDECGPFDWFHEIAHSLGPPPGRRAPEQLISDAVLTYQLGEGGGGASVVYRFVELDRANRSAAELARRIGRYARLFRREVERDSSGSKVALWESLYPVFPGLLVVLSGRPRERLIERRATVLALCRADPGLAAAPEVEVSICLLVDLVADGPFAAICRTPVDPGSDVDWLGEKG
jgi:hypothetical protein